MAELLAGLRQPDRRSCGAACLVAARMLSDPTYAATITHRSFGAETLALHRRITGSRDIRGRPQAPWPRIIGTPPWAVARHLTGLLGQTHRTHPVRRGDGAVDLLTTSGLPAALYVGSRWLPRHVVLVIDVDGDALTCYEPSRGEIVRLDRTDFHGRLGLAGWDHQWFAVTAA